MQITASILRIDPNLVGEALYADLRAIHPEGAEELANGHRSFSCRDRPEADPILLQVRERLARAGMTPAGITRDDAREYYLTLTRVYDEADLAAAPLAWAWPVAEAAAGRRDEAGRIRLGVADLDPAVGLAVAFPQMRYVVPERIRVRLAAAGLAGVAFRETVPATRRGFGTPTTWDDAGEPWWELRSDTFMPPFAPGLDLTDGHGRPLADRADDSEGIQVREGFFGVPELRYTAADLAAMPPFDLAWTRERIGHPADAENRYLIASRRFVGFCREHDLEIDLIPVRVDAP